MSALYLDAVSPNWSAIVWGEYDSAFPVTLSTKASVEQVIQPIFTREFKVLGADQSYKEILGFLSNKFKNVDLRIPKISMSLRVFQEHIK